MIDIIYEKYNVSCTSCYNICSCKYYKFNKFSKKYVYELFKIELENINTKKSYMQQLYSNIDIVRFQMPTGRYLIKIYKNKINYMTICIIIDNSVRFLKIQFKF